MPGRILAPLVALNVIFALTLVTLGPREGYGVFVVAGAFVSVVNLLAIRAGQHERR